MKYRVAIRMQSEYLWWNRVETAAKSIADVKDALFAGRNVFLCCDKELPWKQSFHEILRKELASVSAQKSLEIISGKGADDPALMIFTKMCPPAVRNQYWPDMTYAAFLAEQKDIVLNQRILCVKNIENDEQLEKWFDFVAEYYKEAEKAEHECALFILEYVSQGASRTPPKIIETVSFMPTDFDRYIYCLSKLSGAEDRFAVKQYIAEASCFIGRQDTEFCGRLADYGEHLCKNPGQCVKEILETVRSDGSPFYQITDDEVYSFVLMAQIKVVFPAIERFRIQFIKANEEKLKNHLPVINAFNERIDEPRELEFSQLYLIARTYNSGFSETDKVLLERYKNFRNLLAHNCHIDWNDIKFILNNQ